MYLLNSNTKPGKSIIQKAIENIITEHHADYGRWWAGLNNTERKIIIGIASGDQNPTSGKFIKKYGINSSSTAGSAVNKLLKSGTLVKDHEGQLSIEDPFWKEWIIFSRS